MKKALVIFSIFTSGFTFGQKLTKDQKDIKLVIDRLFEGMKKGDSSMVRSVFHSDSNLGTSYLNKEGKSVFQSEQLIDFLNAVGTPHTEIWNEQIRTCEIKVDDNMASVWTEYTFFIDETYSHEGVNSFQLVRLNGNWRIVNLMDTRRRKK